jgi:heme-degrading monooxygenase HmoA
MSYNRVVTLTGVEDVDAMVAYIRETALSGLRGQKGYQGFSVSADRANGVVGTLSMWETEADRDASDSALVKLREDARAKFATDMTVESLEDRVMEMSKPPAVGTRLMVTRISMDPAKVDENLEAFKNEVLPQIKAAPGFRSMRVMINPQTGEGASGAIYDDEQSMQAAAEAAMARRPDATARGVNFGETSYREILFVDMM